MTIADTLRKKADGLQKKIDHCFHERLTNTRKRAEEDAHQRREGNTLKATQDVMRKLADLHEARACPAAVKDWRHTTEIETAVRVVKNAERFGSLEALTEEQEEVHTLMAGKPQYTEEAADTAEQLYRAGKSMLQVQQATGIDDQAVKRILTARNVPMRTESVKPQYTDEQRAQVIALYTQESLSAREVGRRLGLKVFTVKEWLTKAGVIRTMSEAAALSVAQHKGRSAPYRKHSESLTYRSVKNGVAHYADTRFELLRMTQLDADPTVTAWEKCRDRISYTDPRGKWHTYNPDLRVTRHTGVTVEEIKPVTLVSFGNNPAKFAAARQYYSERNIGFVIVTEDELGRDALAVFHKPATPTVIDKPGVVDPVQRAHQVRALSQVNRNFDECTFPAAPTPCPSRRSLAQQIPNTKRAWTPSVSLRSSERNLSAASTADASPSQTRRSSVDRRSSASSRRKR